MKNLYEPQTLNELQDRLAKLGPGNTRLWGKMTASQALAHCSLAVETAVGDLKLPRVFIGYLLSWIVKGKVFGTEEPLRKNTPTAKELVVGADRDLDKERQRLSTLLRRFAAAGPKGCTTHTHAFFGNLTPEEWAILMYKHTDHHLRQFGA